MRNEVIFSKKTGEPVNVLYTHRGPVEYGQSMYDVTETMPVPGDTIYGGLRTVTALDLVECAEILMNRDGIQYVFDVCMMRVYSRFNPDNMEENAKMEGLATVRGRITTRYE